MSAASTHIPEITNNLGADTTTGTTGVATPETTGELVIAEAPGRMEMNLEGRALAEHSSGSTHSLNWAVRTDVGLVRGHNEDSYLIKAPLFAVCDGMGGHAAGEVASAVAVDALSKNAPTTRDDVLLGAAIEDANKAVIDAPEQGIGKPGMGCTASAVMIEDDRMAVAHVGDSRVYLLHAGSLVRITHDHTFVEELVDSGQITADEARSHPSHSVITRALGSDPDMYADHFSIDVAEGDRVIICSDGLSSMVADRDIEDLAVSSATPRQTADNLVSAALGAGGADNITVIVVDVTDDGTTTATHRHMRERIIATAASIFVLIVIIAVSLVAFISSEWYLGVHEGMVAIYRGVPGNVLGISTQSLIETSDVEVNDLPQSVREQLMRGIRTDTEAKALSAIQNYREQIDAATDKAAEKASAAQAGGANEQTSAAAEGASAAGTSGVTGTSGATGTSGEGVSTSTESGAATESQNSQGGAR